MDKKLSVNEVMDAVNERRLRPVYDFIDAGNYKKALHEADRLLKKQKDLQCAKVLKALSLLRLSRVSEAKQLLDEVYSVTPTDDPTLQAMTLCYREMLQPEMVADVYDRAIKKLSTGSSDVSAHIEELMSHLFMSYVRLGDYQKQQIAANNLYRVKAKNPYYFWHVTSTYLQAISCQDKSKESLLLTLATKKVEKMINEGKIEAEAEVELYLMILSKQNKLKEMLQVLDGPLGKFIPNIIDFVPRRKAFILKDLGDLKGAFDSFMSLLEDNPDQLEYYWSALDIALEMGNESYIQQLVDFVKTLTEKSSKKSKLRGPHIAKIAIYYRLKQEFKENENLSGLMTAACSLTASGVDMFTDFFLYFGHKASFYNDVVFLWHLHQDCHEDVKDFVTNKVTLDTKEPPPDEDAMRRHMVILFLRNLTDFGESGSSKELDMKFVSYLLTLYKDCLRFGADRPVASVINPSDGYAQLAAHVLLQANISSNQSIGNDYILIAIIILHRVIENSPANHTAKLLLILIMNSIGCGNISCSLFESMETKYIMVDTLFYLVTETLSSVGMFLKPASLLSYANKFYSSNVKDSNENTINCYKFGTFAKIEEILQLKDRLMNSIQFYSTTLETNALQLILSANSIEETVDVVNTFVIHPLKKDSLVDNRDIRVFANVTLDLQVRLNDWQEWTFAWESKWVQLRQLIQEQLVFGGQVIRSKTEAVSNGTGTDNDKPDSLNKLLENMSSFSNLVDSLQGFDKNEGALPASLVNQTIVGAHTPRVISFVEEGYLEVIRILLKTMTQALQGTDKLSLSDLHKNVNEIVKKNLERLTGSSKNKNLLDWRPFLVSWVNFVEVMSLTCCILSHILVKVIGSRIVKTAQEQQQTTGGGKKGKKKTAVSGNSMNSFNEVISSEAWNDLLMLLESLCCQSTEFLTEVKMESQENSSFVNSFLSNHDDFLSCKANLIPDINSSYKSSLKDIITVLKFKATFLSTLKV